MNTLREKFVDRVGSQIIQMWYYGAVIGAFRFISCNLNQYWPAGDRADDRSINHGCCAISLNKCRKDRISKFVQAVWIHANLKQYILFLGLVIFELGYNFRIIHWLTRSGERSVLIGKQLDMETPNSIYRMHV